VSFENGMAMIELVGNGLDNGVADYDKAFFE
jgi:hypothetical protein